MHIMVPGQFIVPERLNEGANYYGTPVDWLTGEAAALAIPISGIEEEVFSFFSQTKGRRFNNVCHAKPVDITGNSPVMADALIPIRSSLRNVSTSMVMKTNANLEPIHAHRIMYSNGEYYAATVVFGCTEAYRTPKSFFREYGIGYITFEYERKNPKSSRVQRRGRWYYQNTVYDSASGKTVFQPRKTDYWSLHLFNYIVSPTIGDFTDDWSNRTGQCSNTIYRVALRLLELACGVFNTMANLEVWQDLNVAGSIVEPFSTDPPPIPSSSKFIFGEPVFQFHGVEPVLSGSFLGYWYHKAIQDAYLDACFSVPRLNDNMISNIVEIVQFIYNLVVKHQIEIPESLSDAWLSYRYQYNTTKLDAEEAISFVHRHMDLKGDRALSCYGLSSVVPIQDVTVVCRCGLKIQPRELGTLDKIWRALYTYGLQPNFYVLWDSIPFSFMVDWFLPIGNVASTLDAKKMFSDGYYDINNVIYSLSYNRGNVHYYSRWLGTTPAHISGYYSFEPSGHSDRTTGYRVLDTMSIFIGK